MRISSGTLLTLLAVVASASADPLPCQTGTVADYQNTSCTIGNLSFTFGSATRSASVGFSATPSCFTLTPDASNPNAPGFILSGTVTEATPDIQGGGGVDWTFQLQTLGGQPLMTGLTATVTGPRRDYLSIRSTPCLMPVTQTTASTARGRIPAVRSSNFVRGLHVALTAISYRPLPLPIWRPVFCVAARLVVGPRALALLSLLRHIT